MSSRQAFHNLACTGLTTGDRCATALRDASHSRGRPIAFAWRTASDLAITKTDGVTSVAAGGSLTYTITASNAGPDNATGAIVTDTLPASLTGATWTCVGAGGGTCTAAGSGNINDTVNLPAGASVAYTLSGTVAPDATPGDATSTAALTPPAGFSDPSPTNNSASAITSIHASVAVPTLSEWATGLMAALMALGAACGLRRRDRQRG